MYIWIHLMQSLSMQSHSSETVCLRLKMSALIIFLLLTTRFFQISNLCRLRYVRIGRFTQTLFTLWGWIALGVCLGNDRTSLIVKLQSQSISEFEKYVRFMAVLFSVLQITLEYLSESWQIQCWKNCQQILLKLLGFISKNWNSIFRTYSNNTMKQRLFPFYFNVSLLVLTC